MRILKNPKYVCLFIAYLLSISSIFSQSNQWTWMKGDRTIEQLGIYGTQGTAAAANKPGSRSGSVSWTDALGNLWLFGGEGNAASGGSGRLNDLWKYNPATNQWTWMKGDNTTNQLGIYGTQGMAAAANKPGARSGSLSWTDASGNLWLFGGAGYAASGGVNYLTDLWKYNPTTNQWTWVKEGNSVYGVYGTQGIAATANNPGGRGGSGTWTDTSGNLWLFGGDGFSCCGYGYLNDLWKYNLATNQWTWVKGDNTTDQLSIFGTQGTASASNKLGCRYGSVTWTDATGNLWLFGGGGKTASGNGRLNDLWKYNRATNEWTWVKGDNTKNQLGIYGTQGTAAASNKPGARDGSVSWTDASGKLWLFGGGGIERTSSSGYLNDLWNYNQTTNEWTWLKGDSTLNQLGIYGTQGTAATANKPGARQQSVTWTDAIGNLWLFGGLGYAASGVSGKLNDLWKFTLPLLPTITSFTPTSAASGATVTITGTNFSGATAVSFGGTPAASFVVVNATTITAVVGTGASGSVSVTSPGGIATLGGFTFSCMSVSISNVTAANNPICTNKTTTLSANGVAGTNAIVNWWTGSGGTGTNLGTGLTLPNVTAGMYYARVTGKCGSPAEAMVTVIKDTIRPTVVCPSNITTNNAAGCSKNVLIPAPSYNDNCSIKSVQWQITGASTYSSANTGINVSAIKDLHNGINKISYRVVDSSNNIATCYFNLLVADIVKPVFTSTIKTPLNNTNLTQCTGMVKFPPVAFSDNCGTPVLQWMMSGANNVSGTGKLDSMLMKTGTTQITYSLKDNAGNTTTAYQIVNVTERVSPTIDCPSGIVKNIAGCCTPVVNPAPVYADNCSIQSLVWNMTGATTLASPASGINLVGTQYFNAGTTFINYVVRDSSNNPKVCTYKVLVKTSTSKAAKGTVIFEQEVKGLSATLVPNPTTTGFGLMIQSDKLENTTVIIYSSNGQKIEQRQILPNRVTYLGETYKKGAYLFEVRQGEKRTTVVGVKR